MKENRLKLIMLAVIVALVASACSSGGGDDSAESAVDVATDLSGIDADDAGLEQFSLGDGGDVRTSGADEAAPGEAPDQDPLGSGALTVQANPIDLGRDIIYTASIAVEETSNIRLAAR